MDNKNCIQGERPTENLSSLSEDRQMIEQDPASSRMRGILIEALDYGFTVKIGCQRFAIETKERLIEKLTEYINNPWDVEKKWTRSKEI